MKKFLLYLLLIIFPYFIFSQDSYVKGFDFHNNRNKEENNFTISKTKINNRHSDIASTFYKGKLLMYSSRVTGEIGVGKDRNTKAPFYNLYCVEIDEKGMLARPNFFSRSLTNKGNEAGVTFSPDERKMYIVKSSKDNSSNYQLYMYSLNPEKCGWIDETPVTFNDKNYSIEDPSISSDGSFIYFSSNMPGGFGGYDLYKAALDADGMPLSPINLGNTINSEKDEKFPFLFQTENELYFSSNGYDSKGGFDVFVSKIVKDEIQSPINLGESLNTKADEIAFKLKQKNNGYFSSNREESKGSFDIFYFKIGKNEIAKTALTTKVIKGKIVEKETQIALRNTEVNLLSKEGNLVDKKITNEEGQYEFEGIPDTKDLSLMVKREGYLDVNFPLEKIEEASQIDLVQKNAEIIDNKIVLEKLYFEFNSSELNIDSQLSLNKVVKVLKEKPQMNITVTAHTDSRGSEEANLILSELRSSVVKYYLLKNGISESRIKSIGYGKSKPLSGCKKDCTEEDYSKDRRVEFIIE